jgi:hypothetical protein
MAHVERPALPRSQRSSARAPLLLMPLKAKLWALVYVSLLFVGCPCFRDPINASPQIRWWLFANFGAHRICPEMQKRAAPLRLAPNPNAVGRFFPEQCQTTVNDAAQTVTLSFSGTGYAWTPIGGRVGFSVAASVEYRMDFYLAEEAVYVWARPARIVSGPTFHVTSIEYKVANWAAQGPAGYLMSMFGNQVVSAELASGFTVVRHDEGDEFALGILQPPRRPPRPFDTSSGRYAFANETTEVHPEQIDLLGPFEVAANQQALFARLFVVGPAIDILVIQRGTGDLWRRTLQEGGALAPPPQPPITSFTLVPGVEQRQKIPLAPGQYYLALDNSSRAGNVRPPFSPLGVLGGNAAVVSYVVELGDSDEQF